MTKKKENVEIVNEDVCCQNEACTCDVASDVKDQLDESNDVCCKNGSMCIDVDGGVPTEEDIERFEAEFKEAHDKYTNMEDFVIAEGDKGKSMLEAALFYNNEIYIWKGEEFNGVIYFNELYSDMLLKYNLGEISKFTLDKNSVQWLFYILSNMSGLGLEAAKQISEKRELFAELCDSINECSETIKKCIDDIKYTQDKVAAAHQGFFCKRYDGE